MKILITGSTGFIGTNLVSFRLIPINSPHKIMGRNLHVSTSPPLNFTTQGTLIRILRPLALNMQYNAGDAPI